MSQHMSNALKKLHRQFLALTRAKGHFMKTSVGNRFVANSVCLNCGLTGHLDSQPDQALKEKFMNGPVLTTDCPKPSRCAECNETVHPNLLKKYGGICNVCHDGNALMNKGHGPYRDIGMDTWTNRLRLDDEGLSTPRHLTGQMGINDMEDLL